MDISNLKSMLQGKITREQCIQVAVITGLDALFLQEINDSEDSLNLLIDKLRESGRIQGTDNDVFLFALDQLHLTEVGNVEINTAVPACICGTSFFHEIKSENDDSRILILRCSKHACSADWFHSTANPENTSASPLVARNLSLNWKGDTFSYKTPYFIKLSDLSNECVTDASKLRRGDHLIFRRLRGIFDHHAILVEVNNDTMKVIEWTSDDTDGKPRAKILLKDVSFPQDGVMRRTYNQSDNADVVVARAYDAMNSSSEKYDLVTNNCENLATYCKVGRSFSFQSDALQNILPPFICNLVRASVGSSTRKK